MGTGDRFQGIEIAARLDRHHILYVANGDAVMGWVPVLAAIVSAIAVVAAAIFTAVQTNKRGLKEKIWTSKLETYADIFEALDVMGRWVDAVSEETQRDFKITPAFERQKRKKFEAAYESMRKAVVRGTVLLSDEVEGAVSDFFFELRQADADRKWASHVLRKTAAVSNARLALKRLASKDLGLPLEGRARRERRSRAMLRGSSTDGLFWGAIYPTYDARRSDFPVSNGAVYVRRNRDSSDDSL